MAHKFFSAITAAAALAFTASAANATVFTGTWELSILETTDPGLVLNTTKWDGSFNKNLSSDPIQELSLFKLWTDETTLNPDDTVWSPIQLTFNFSAPANNNSPLFINGDTGGQYSFFGIIQGGKLVWDNGGQAVLNWGVDSLGNNLPGVVTPGKMTITVNGGTFNEGAFGLDEGKKNGLKVDAEFHWDNDPVFSAAVPEPGTWALMIGGFGMAGATLRRRRALSLAA